MKTEYFKHFSTSLNRDMEYKVYGESGQPILVFPSQNGRFFDFEDQGMVDCIKDFIESNRIVLYTCDSNDLNSFSDQTHLPPYRINQQEAYYHYIVDELVPIIQKDCITPKKNTYKGILTTGCSMGAYHALNSFLRRPDLFSGVIGLSGAYDIRFFFNDYFDSLCYDNSPVDYINGMHYDHPYVEKYRQSKIILCCGRGAYENPMQEDLARMQELFFYKDIPAWIDFWGLDVSHDWVWWRKQLPYFLEAILHD